MGDRLASVNDALLVLMSSTNSINPASRYRWVRAWDFSSSKLLLPWRMKSLNVAAKNASMFCSQLGMCFDVVIERVESLLQPQVPWRMCIMHVVKFNIFLRRSKLAIF
jgi:hypothetical protein